MKILHASDLHGNIPMFPRADVYVLTGDLLPNFPVPPEARTPYGSRIDAARERVKQAEWCMMNGLRRMSGIPEDAPVVVVRGNHDFVDLSDWIGGDVWEVTLDPTRTTTLFGLKFGGCRGINAINGTWSDELMVSQFDERARALPMDLDVLVTHSPPRGILDRSDLFDVSTDEYVRYGSSALRNYLDRRFLGERSVELRAHLFGHVHEDFGEEEHEGCRFSNAATWWRVVELE